LEVLSERIVPAGQTFVWTGAGINAFVSNGQNWNQNGATPGVGDILVFNAGNKAADYDVNAPGSLERIEIVAGYAATVTINRDVAVGNFSLQAAAPTSLEVASGQTLSVGQGTLAGNLSGSGTVEVSVGAVPSFSVVGITQLSVGTFRMNAGSVLNIQAALTVGGTCQIIQSGTTTWTGGPLRLQGGTSLDNSGTFKIESTASTLEGGGRFRNFGIVCKQNAANTTTISASFQSTAAATIQVHSGQLKMRGSGDDGGIIDVSIGGKFYWEGTNNRKVSAPLVLTGLGEVWIGSFAGLPTTLNVASFLTSNVATLYHSEGVLLQGAGVFVSNGAYVWRSGEIRGFGANFTLNAGLFIQTSDSKLVRDTTMTLKGAQVGKKEISN
jgi:hypothetical protein